MLLKNFGAILANALTDDPLTEGIKCTTGELPASANIKNMPSTVSALNTVVKSATYIANSSTAMNAAWAFIFGDGTTQPTIDDYKLSGDIVEPDTVSGTGSASNGTNGATFQMTVINNTESAMTINEIGLCTQVVNSGCLMLTHDVLPEPVVLEAGGSKGFQIYIDTQSFISNAAQA